MKSRLFTFTLALFVSLNNFAQASVTQKAQNSSYNQYFDYLKNQGHQSYAEAYLAMIEKLEINSPSIEDCLVALMQESQENPSCDKAIYDLTRKPLNNMSREILASLLYRMTKSNLQEKQFFNSFLNSLLQTHPEMKNNLSIQKKSEVLKTNRISKLEYSAFLKTLQKKTDFKDLHLLINGKIITNLRGFEVPQGVYQWGLITNTFKPFVFVGTWQQFAAKAQKNLEPFFAGSCEDLEKIETTEQELLNTEIFLTAKCVKSTSFLHQTNLKASHLSDLPFEKEPTSLKKNKWFWGSVITAVGVGALSASLQNKKVRVTLPGFN